MTRVEQVVRVYEDLAYAYDRQGQARLRDCFLVLAADAAFTSGWEEEADRLRVQLLSFNPHHLLKPYVSFADALRSPDIQSYIDDLRVSHPPEAAERELRKLQPELPGFVPGGTYMATVDDAPPPPPPPPPPNGRNEEPRVYKMKTKTEESKPAAPPPPPARPTPPMSRPAPVASAPARTPPPSPRPTLPDWRADKRLPFTEATTEKTGDHHPPDGPSLASQWFSTILFFLLLVAGLSLAVYTLAGPFLPKEWLGG